MTLDKVKRGQVVKIISISNESVRVQAVRLGIAEGTVVTCREIVPAGPVIISRHRQEIAVGRSLARNIKVEPVLGQSKVSSGDWKKHSRSVLINW